MLVVEVASVALARVVGAEVVVVITGGGVALVVAWLVTTEAVFEVPADSVLSVNGAELVTLPAVVATVVVVLFTVGLEVALVVGTALLARASSCELLDTGIEVIVEAVPNKLLADAPTLPVIELSKLSAVVDTGIEVTAEAAATTLLATVPTVPVVEPSRLFTAVVVAVVLPDVEMRPPTNGSEAITLLTLAVVAPLTVPGKVLVGLIMGASGLFKATVTLVPWRMMRFVGARFFFTNWFC